MSCVKEPVQSTEFDLELPKEQVKHFNLENGITLLVLEDQRNPVVSVQAWCRAGSITEGEFLGCGISHILEHMLFKGTERRGNSEIAQTIQSIGGYTNAYTSFDRTVYYIDAPSKGWKTALDVLVDAMFFSTIPEDEYIKEMEVVRREFAMGFDDPSRTLQKLLFATAFTEHPYQYPIIGYLDNFNRLTRDDVLEYYKRLYLPNNFTFIVSGNVDADEVLAALNEFSASVKRAPLKDVYIPSEPRQLGMRERHEAFPTDASRFYLAYHIPGITHPDLYALDVMAILAGQGKSSRLHQNLVEGKGVLRGVGAFSYTPAQSGLWAVSGVMHPNPKVSRTEVVGDVIAELESFRQKHPSSEELAKAKRVVISDRVSEMETVSGKASSLGSSWFIARDTGFSDRYLEGIKAVQAEDIVRVANTYFKPENLSVVSINPEEALATQGDQTQSPEASKKSELIHLENGLPMVVVSDNTLPLVSLTAVMRGGLLLEDPGQAGISTLTGRLLEKGTKRRSAANLAEVIDSLGGTLAVQSANNSISVTIQILEPDLETAIDLLSEVLFEPAFSDEELKKEQRKMLSDLQLENDQPMRIARNHLRDELFQSHPYARNTLGTAEALEAISRDDVIAFHQKLLSKNNIVLALAGRFDLSRAKSLIEESFREDFLNGDLVLSERPSDFGGNGQTLSIDTEKVQAIVQIGFPGISVDNENRVALELIDQALSDLASRLFIRIREEQSLAYFVGAAQLIGLDPGYFMFYAGTRPDAAERVRDELLDEVNLMVESGLDAGEFERAKAKLEGRRLLENQSATRQAFVTAINVLYGLGIDYEARYQAELDALTQNDVHQVAKRVFGDKNFVCVIVQPPETKKE
ncbi:MAG: pitrilysin family protein [Verrucomicrobiota bacterium]